jgi:hypothetical protein
MTGQRTREPEQAEEAEHQRAGQSDDLQADAAVGQEHYADQHKDGRSDRRRDRGAPFGGKRDTNRMGRVTTSTRQRPVAGTNPSGAGHLAAAPSAKELEVEVHHTAAAKKQHADEPK